MSLNLISVFLIAVALITNSLLWSIFWIFPIHDADSWILLHKYNLRHNRIFRINNRIRIAFGNRVEYDSRKLIRR